MRFFSFSHIFQLLLWKGVNVMYGYPGIQVEKVIEDQEKYLSEQIDEVIEMMEKNLNELEKLAAELDDLLQKD